jgi:hypothetical protein
MKAADVKITLSATERQCVVEILQRVFSSEYRVAIQAMHKYAIAERRQESRPYFVGFCPLLLAFRRARISSVVRRTVFTEVEMNLQELPCAHRMVCDSAGGAVAHPPVCGGEQGSSATLVELLCDRVLPSFRCSCKPRIGERAPRVVGTRRLCRHVAQVAFKFLEEYIVVAADERDHHQHEVPPLEPVVAVAASELRKRRILAADPTGPQSGNTEPPRHRIRVEPRVHVEAAAAPVPPAAGDNNETDFAAALMM